MNADLTKKLCEVAPTLYRGRHHSIQSNLISLGIDTGDGWYDLIYNLSVKLEALIKKQDQDTNCMNCSCDKKDHYASATPKPKQCLRVRKDWDYIWNGRAKHWWSWPIWFVKEARTITTNFYRSHFNYKLHACWCDGYEPAVAIAVQVKEKYASLRFYIHCGTDEMYKLIDEAERLSAKTCESCGLPGVMRGENWYFTACDAHGYDSGGNYSPPTGSNEH